MPNKRGRKPPIHEPIVCTGCLASPRISSGKLLPCQCGAKWNIHLIEERCRPEWLRFVEWTGS